MRRFVSYGHCTQACKGRRRECPLGGHVNHEYMEILGQQTYVLQGDQSINRNVDTATQDMLIV